MFTSLKRLLHDRLGVASRDDVVANRKTIEHSAQRVMRGADKNTVRLAKRLDAWRARQTRAVGKRPKD